MRTGKKAFPILALATALGLVFQIAASSTEGPASAQGEANTEPAGPTAPIFTDVTKEAGIDFLHSFGDQEMSSILEATGPGCAFLDFDQDGDLDIYLINGANTPGINDPWPEGRDAKKDLTNRLYRNNGDGTFADVTEKAGVGDTGNGMGVIVADYDNDGDPDIYVANYGPNLLYRNNGNGTFGEVAETAGVSGPKELKGFPKWSLHGAFFDYDKDGWLDLYVANYLAFDPEYQYYFGPEGFPGPLSYEGQPDFLYRNNGDGTFTDVTEKAGVFNSKGRAMSVGAADFDNNGYPDVFVANDAMENFLYRNRGDGTFEEVALMRGVAFGEFGEATSSMAPVFEDLDNDADLDLLVPDMGYSCLYRNDGDLFAEVSAVSGIAVACGQYTSWAPVTMDYDNDGLQDIFITNGDAHHLYTEEDLLLRNKGNLTFEDVSLSSGDYFTKAEYVGRGAAFGDYDNDGDVDILVANVNSSPVLLRNDGGNKSHWLSVRTVGKESNRDGIGARVLLTAGPLQQMREIKTASGYLSSNDPRAHFGLGTHDKVSVLEIRWPSGAIQKLENVQADQFLTIEEPAAQPAKETETKTEKKTESTEP